MTSARKRKKQVYRAMARQLAQRLFLQRLLKRFVRRKIVRPIVKAISAALPFGIFSASPGVLGGLYTRGGDDVQRLVRLSGCGMSGEFECIKAPVSGWCIAGDLEWNLLRRYQPVKGEPC